MAKQRYSSIDSMRILAAALVVCIHTTSLVGVKAIARIAVPFFFMTAGYFLFLNGIKKERLHHQIKKMAGLLAASNLAYFLFDILANFRHPDKIAEIMGGLASPAVWLDFLLFNQSPFGYHLWFIGGLLYCLLFTRLIIGWKHWRILYAFIPIPILFSILCGFYANVVLGGPLSVEPFADVLYQFLLIGFPYFLIGAFFAEHPKLGNRISNKALLVLIVLLAAASVLEAYLLGGQVGKGGHMFFSTPLLASAVMLAAVKNPGLGGNTPLPRLGVRYSLGIYLVHIAVRDVVRILLDKLGFGKVYEYGAFVLVFGASLFLCFLTRAFYVRLRQRSTEKKKGF